MSMWCAHKTLLCTAVAGALLMAGDSKVFSTPSRPRTLTVQDIRPTAPSENLGYYAEIDLLPNDEQVYTGQAIGVDIVRQHNTGSLFIESTLRNGQVQYWTPGPWCPHQNGFAYTLHQPTHGEVFTLCDEDGYLTRGLFAKLDTTTLQGAAAQTIIEPLTIFFDHLCYQHSAEYFAHRLDFTRRHSMYYQMVQEREDGSHKTVRINPARHTFVLPATTIQAMLATEKQCQTYHQIQDTIENWCAVLAGHQKVLGPIDGGTCFAVTLSPDLQQAAAQPLEEGKRQVIFKLKSDMPEEPSQDIARLITHHPQQGRTTIEEWPIVATFTKSAAGNVVHQDGHATGDYIGLSLTLAKTEEVQPFLTAGPLYYHNQARTQGGVAESWHRRSFQSAQKVLLQSAQQAFDVTTKGQLATYLGG